MKLVNNYFIDEASNGKMNIIKIVGFILLCIIFSTLIGFSNIYSQWSNNPAENTQVSPRGSSPRIISDGDGGAYIAYWDTILIVQRLNKYGYPQFPDYGIQIGSAGHIQTSNYFLVTDGSGGVIIIYENSNVVGTNTFYKAFAQRIDSIGTKVWGESGLDFSPAMDQTILKTACSDGAGGVCIFWMENYKNINGGVYDLRMQRITPSGELLFGAQGTLISAYTTGILHYYEVPEMYSAHNFNGTFISYADKPDTAKYLKVQRISDTGEMQWDNGIKVEFIGNMIDDGFGGVIIGGMFFKYGSHYFPRVAAQKFNGNGNLEWKIEIPMGSENLMDRTLYVGVNFDGTESYHLVWNSESDISSEVYMQTINLEGILQWRIDLGYKITQAYRNQLAFNGNFLVSNNDFNTVLVWRGDWKVIFCQMTDNNGNVLWREKMAYPVDSGTPQLATDMIGGAIACWHVEGPRRVSLGVYAQQISKNGKLGEIITSIKDDYNPVIPREYALYQSYPNPFNQITKIKFDLPEASSVVITIYNVLGQNVATLINGRLPAGRHEREWNAARFSSGIYFVRMQAGDFVKTTKVTLLK